MSADARTLAARLEAALPLIGAAGHHILLSLCHDAAVLLRDLAAERDTAEAALEQCDWERRSAVAELAYLKGKVKRLTAERDHAEVSALDAQVRLDRIADAVDGST